MDSFPMVSQCFEAQWRGLSQHDREWLREMKFGLHVRDLSFAHSGQREEVTVLPLWWIEGNDSGYRVELMSIKYF